MLSRVESRLPIHPPSWVFFDTHPCVARLFAISSDSNNIFARFESEKLNKTFQDCIAMTSRYLNYRISGPGVDRTIVLGYHLLPYHSRGQLAQS